jgi:hypothetical protein
LLLWLLLITRQRVNFIVQLIGLAGRLTVSRCWRRAVRWLFGGLGGVGGAFGGVGGAIPIDVGG